MRIGLRSRFPEYFTNIYIWIIDWNWFLVVGPGTKLGNTDQYYYWNCSVSDEYLYLIRILGTTEAGDSGIGDCVANTIPWVGVCNAALASAINQ